MDIICGTMIVNAWVIHKKVWKVKIRTYFRVPEKKYKRNYKQVKYVLISYLIMLQRSVRPMYRKRHNISCKWRKIRIRDVDRIVLRLIDDRITTAESADMARNFKTFTTVLQ